jgi:hypothetical protein
MIDCIDGKETGERRKKREKPTRALDDTSQQLSDSSTTHWMKILNQ